MASGGLLEVLGRRSGAHPAVGDPSGRCIGVAVWFEQEGHVRAVSEALGERLAELVGAASRGDVQPWLFFPVGSPKKKSARGMHFAGEEGARAFAEAKAKAKAKAKAGAVEASQLVAAASADLRSEVVGVAPDRRLTG